MPETVAVIDVGSNSIKLLVASLDKSGKSIKTVCSKTIETRISEGINHDLPTLTQRAIARGTATILELYHLSLEHKPNKIAIVATSAVRDAKNSATFLRAVIEATDLHMRILSGTEEARYIGLGLNCDPAIREMRRFIQIDIGGGSLELIRFEGGSIRNAISLPLGSVRLTECFVADKTASLPLKSENALREFVRTQIIESGFDFYPIDLPLIATGGAFSISRVVLAEQEGNTLAESSPRIERGVLKSLKQKLATSTLEERLKIAQLPPERADILPVALITIDALLEYASRHHITHSFYNLRYGIAADILFALK